MVLIWLHLDQRRKVESFIILKIVKIKNSFFILNLFLGETQLNVLCDNQAVTDQPFKVNVEEGFDEKKINVYGKNLNNGTVGEYNEFTIDTRNAGFANLNLGKKNIFCF